MKRRSVSFEDDVFEGIEKRRSKTIPIPSFTKTLNELLRRQLEREKP